MATSHINQRRIASMCRFAQRYSSSLTCVELHLSNNGAEMAKIMRKCIVECGNDSIGYSPLHKCAFYSSVLLGFLPSLKPHIIHALIDAGAHVELIETQEQRARVGFVLQQGIESSSVNMCCFGQAVLLLYKNLSSSETYEGFMTDITKELRAHAVVPENQELNISFRLVEACLINGVIGFKHELKKAVLEHILEVSQNQTGPFAAVCEYLCEILAWTGMESMVSIVDNLLLTRSTILDDPRISGEAVNLVGAINKINAVTRPEYFCILEPPTETLVLERSRFPTIIDIAESIRERRSNVVSQFLTATCSENDELVTSLTRLHLSNILMTLASVGR